MFVLRSSFEESCTLCPLAIDLPGSNSSSKLPVSQAFHTPHMVTYVKKATSFLGVSEHTDKAPNKSQPLRGIFACQHLKLTLGIFLISLGNNFRNAQRDWILLLPEQFNLFNWVVRSTKDKDSRFDFTDAALQQLWCVAVYQFHNRKAQDAEDRSWILLSKIKNLNPIKALSSVKGGLWDHKGIASEAKIPSIFPSSLHATDLSLYCICDRRDKWSDWHVQADAQMTKSKLGTFQGEQTPQQTYPWRQHIKTDISGGTRASVNFFPRRCITPGHDLPGAYPPQPSLWLTASHTGPEKEDLEIVSLAWKHNLATVLCTVQLQLPSHISRPSLPRVMHSFQSCRFSHGNAFVA